jgi:hypothetical protein
MGLVAGKEIFRSRIAKNLQSKTHECPEGMKPILSGYFYVC